MTSDGDPGAWTPALHSKYRRAICRGPRHDGPRAPLPPALQHQPWASQAPGQLQHGSPGRWGRAVQWAGAGANKGLTVRLGVGTWPCKEAVGSAGTGAGLGSVSWGRGGKTDLCFLTVQHRFRIEKGSGCCQPGRDTLFPRPHARPCPPLSQDGQKQSELTSRVTPPSSCFPGQAEGLLGRRLVHVPGGGMMTVVVLFFPR